MKKVKVTNLSIKPILCLIENLFYFFFFFRGVIGSGTMILSKWPFVETNFRQFSMNGFKHQVWYGDALAGSGIGMARLKIGFENDVFLLNVYVSHYHAEYDR